MKKMGKNGVIMTSQICENDLLQKNKYFVQTSRHISFKIGWVDFPYKILVMDLFCKKCYFYVFAVSP